MDTGSNKFGRGPRELTGGLDLISYYKLLPHHEFFCKKSGSVSLLDTHYLYDVVGDTDIRKGEGMQLDQLIQNTFPRNTNSCIEPFNLDVLGEAFHLQESASVDLPPKRKRDADEDTNGSKKHRKSKDKSSKNEVGLKVSSMRSCE